MTVRLPAVPLVVNDPYLSVWSTTDKLIDQWSRHWTGKTQALCGIARVDGKSYRFMGAVPRYLSVDLPPMQQTSMEVRPTRTIYQFEQAGIRVTLTFLTPLLPFDLDWMARPVTYVDMQVASIDGQKHSVGLYIDVASNLAVNIPEQEVVWGRHRLHDLDLLWIGSKEQDVLGKAGDDVRIDWGYLYVASWSQQDGKSALGGDVALREHFVTTGGLPLSDDFDMPRRVGERPPMTVAAWAFNLGTVSANPLNRHVVITYDDQFSVEYMYCKLRPYWRRHGANAGDLVQTALNEYAAIRQRCEAFDAELMGDLERVGGPAYARLAALAFRQCIAAHKLVVENDGTPLFFSKENFSNGCMGTVDVTYPSSPFFLLFNPNLLEAQLTPILDYSVSGRWPWPYAPHDIGRYPIGNGQVYGGGELTETHQMPVEECGNMLLLVGALCKARGDVSYAGRYHGLLRSWAQYLCDKGLDPENQLCTDDFAGHLAHNVNLSLKAIVAVGAFAWLCEAQGIEDEATQFRTQAEDMAAKWVQMADDGDHYRLTFDKPGTWSQKYNLVWDKLLGLNLFPAEVAQKEVASYRARQGRYGLPLDSRSAYTKLDWIIWSATLSEDPSDLSLFVEPIDRWLNETETRVPLCDWYYTDSGKQAGFQARSVVGGVYIPLLYHADLWQKWMQR